MTMRSVTRSTQCTRHAGRRLVMACCSALVAAACCLGAAPFDGGRMPAAHAAGGSCEIGKTNYVTDTPWTEAALGMDAVRSLADGDGITVAVVDSGVDTSNPHLAGTAVLPGVNLVGDGATDGRTDNYGHGTVVAGIIAARQVEGSALVGIAPKATILPVRVYDTVSNESSHSQGGPSPQMLAKGIRYAADHGAQIINVSQSTVTADDGLRSAVTYAQGKGSLIVASAGNRNTSSSTQDAPRYPASWPDVLGVAAADTSFHASADSISGSQVDILAPGMAVTSTIPRGVDCVFSSDAAASSYATAFASAAAALVAQRYPDETASQWMQRIEASGNRPNPDSRDDDRGWGQLNPYGAITMTLANGLRGPASSSYESHAPEGDSRQRVRIVPTPDGDHGTSLAMTLAGVSAIIVIIMLVTVRVMRDSRTCEARRTVLDAKPHSAATSDKGHRAR